MKRSRAYSLGGSMLLITAGAYLLAYAFDPFELGDELRSPIGAAMCVLGIAAGAGLLAAAVVFGRAERREKHARRAARERAQGQ